MRGQSRHSITNAFMTLLLILISIFNLLVPNYSDSMALAAAPYPPKTQKKTATIKSVLRSANPGVYWYSLDSGELRADYDGRSKTVRNEGTCDVPYPIESDIPDEVDLSRWPAQAWHPHNGINIPSSVVENIELDTVEYQNVMSYTPFNDKPTKSSGTKVKIHSLTGGNHMVTNRTEFQKSPSGCSKQNILYATPVDIIWKGEISEQKEIEVTLDSTINVGQTKQLTASVKTKAWNSASWGNYVSVGARSQTTWESSDLSIAEVSATGQVEGKAPGRVTVHAIWENDGYRISDSVTIIVTGDPGLVVNLPTACTIDTATPKQAQAILTKNDMSTHTLTAHPKLTWRSSNTNVATIGADGKITIRGIVGSTNITATFNDPAQSINETDTQVLNVEDCGTGGPGNGGPGSGNPGGSGQCTWTLGSPSQSNVRSQSDMNPNVSAVVRADSRDAERFDVLKGIPTSESLFTNAFTDNYLFKQEWAQMAGSTTYSCNIEVTYAREWTVPGPSICTTPTTCVPGPPVPAGDVQTRNYSFQFAREYSFWKIKNLEVYGINRAEITNYALPGGTVTMTPSGYSPPTVESVHDDSVNSHVRPQDTLDILYIPPVLIGGLNSPPPVPDDTSRLLGMAESNTPETRVNNDTVRFNGTTIMEGSEATKNGPTPTNIPNPTPIGRDVLYKPNNMISKTLLNKADTISTGTIFYDLLPNNINGGANTQFSINGINTVTVHTPVVNYSLVTDDREHNQKTTPNPRRAAFILERPFTVRMPTSGQHVNYLGYGDRDYAKYFRTKQVLFPFDVYSEDKSRFIPANTWIDIPVNQLDTTFFLPVWVDEGNYQVYFRSIAENAPSNFTTQPDANTNLEHHVATDEVSVEVIGRLYDFKVTDIADYNWELVFRSSKGSSNHTGNSYWVGYSGIDGLPRGNSSPFKLPILPGSHPLQGYKNVSVKTGYHFKFDFKTKGNMFSKTDAVRITPTFSFVSKDGTNRVPVDLYYHTSAKKFIKIGSSDDKVQRYVILNDRLRNVPVEHLTDTAVYKFDHYLTPNERFVTNRTYYTNDYINKLTKEKTIVGGYSLLTLPHQLRTFIGPKGVVPTGASANGQRINAAIQQWYGEYSLPAEPYIVRQGTNIAEYGRTNGGLTDKSPLFLKNGYIIVNFNIESIQNGNASAPHLQYKNAPLMSQWRMEGYNTTVRDSYGNKFNLQEGDVVFYHADKSSRDDFSSQVTH